MEDLNNKIYIALKDYVTSPDDWLGYFPEDKYGCIRLADLDKEHIDYLLDNKANLKPLIYAAAADAFLGDDICNLLKVIPETEWIKIREDTKWCTDALETAVASISNDDEFTVSPTLRFAHKLGMLRQAVEMIKELRQKVVHNDMTTEDYELN